ncbi:MAG: PEP-CTERM sorting domain-containing protein [Methyloprofundus sp.]|nr:PEP-CTERM sorting domain-containing protein [Methyloprofundus sp.]
MGVVKIMKKIIFSLVLLSSSTALQAGLINGGFESPSITPGTPSSDFISTLQGWETTDTHFEVWSDGFNGVTSYEGAQHIELNAFINGTLSQTISPILATTQVGFQFAHRGRSGDDIMNLTITDLGINNLIGGGDDTELFSKNYTTGNTAWSFYTDIGETPILAIGNNIVFAYSAISSAGGVGSGNFLDNVDFGVNVGSVPEPTSLILVSLSLAGLMFSSKKKTI